MLEVFTVGGGEYMVNVFNAVAAWTGGGGYKSLIRVVLVMGLIYSLLVVAFTLNVKAWLNWFLQATAIYLCLMVPTVDIKVTDRVNPSLAPATVANVPIGLGVLASFTSQVGDWLTRTAETVFVMPSQLNYTSNGMVYGARLFDATRNFEIRDAEFSTNLQNHFKSCLFGDIMLYKKSLTQLAAATDLWDEIGPGSQSRAQLWLERQNDGTVNSYIITCKEAYDLLDGKWENMINANTNLWGKQVYPKLSNEQAAAKLRQDVPIVNAAFTGSAHDYTATMRQNTAIGAFLQARDGMAGGAGASAIDTFAITRADIQARNTYNSIAQQAMSWVPILNIVLTVVFFAMFPVIFPLFLMPQTGVAALKGYISGFFYLAAWGPLYVIQHMICMSRAESAANAVAPGGMSLGTYAGIGAVNSEAATIAGFMLMSVPFLAAGLAKGALSIANQATSVLAPAQNAAEAAANEQTTGNYAYGNVSYANTTSNMMQSNQWSDAPSYTTGAMGFGARQDNGAMVSSYGNGKEVYDTSNAISRLAFTPTQTQGSMASQSETAAYAARAASAFEKAADDITTHAHTIRSGTTTTNERTSGYESSSGVQSGSNVESFDRTTEGSTRAYNSATSVGRSDGAGSGTSQRDTGTKEVRGSVRGGMEFGGSGGGGGVAGKLASLAGIKAGGDLSASAGRQWADSAENHRSGDDTRSLSNQLSHGYRDEHNNGENASVSDGTYARSGSFSRSSSTSSQSSGVEDSLSKAQSYRETARQLRELSETLSKDASYSQSHGMALSENMSQELAQWYRDEMPNVPNAPELYATVMTDQQRSTREAMVQRWLGERQEAIRSEIDDLLQNSDLSEMQLGGPSYSSSSDVSRLYSPQANPKGPSGGGGTDGPSEAGKIIENGKARMEVKKDRASDSFWRDERHAPVRGKE